MQRIARVARFPAASLLQPLHHSGSTAALQIRPAATFARCFSSAASSAAAAAAASLPFAAAPSAASAASSSLLTPSQLLHLRSHGWLVMDPPSSSPFADAAMYRRRLRESVLGLSDSGHLTLNHTHLVAKRRVAAGSASDTAAAMDRSFVPKRCVFEADFAARPGLLDAAHADALPEPDRTLWTALAADTSLLSGLNAALALSSAAFGSPPCTLDRQTIKAHVISGGGGCFPIHCDTAPKVDSRRITAILYLNPQWHPTDGGALRLYPFPHAHVDVQPTDGRIVLFDSRRMHHRVLPTAEGKQRVCVSWWMWQQQEQWAAAIAHDAAVASAASTADEPSPFVAQQLSSLRSLLPHASAASLRALSHLLSPPYLPHLTRLCLESEWFTSLEQAHPTDSPITSQLLVRHLDECEMIDAALRALIKQLPKPASVKAMADGSATSNEDDYSQAWRSLFPLPPLPPHDSLEPSPRLVEWLD